MNNDAYYKMTYGLYVLSSTNGSKSSGCIANTFVQVTAQPARFAIACNKDNYTCGLISESQVFAVSILQQDTKAELIGHFGFKSGKDINKYDSVRHKIGKTGAPILLEDTLAWFECKVVQTMDVGTHMLFVGEVVDGDVMDSTQPPLTYAYYRDVKKGKSPKNAPTYLTQTKEDSMSNTPSSADKYVCTICAYVYDPAVGDPDAKIPAGTRFEDLPEDWVCPICGACKAEFEKES
jgi:flavin reductase (DIM6/NTAB) family NADH-FMN oxidoreductase RutF/rubredoxin